jgi:phosphinothricin acetyltransferase
VIAIRPATAADLPAICAIYNHEVAHTTATLDTEPSTPASRAAWLADRDPARHPILVAEEAGAILAWAATTAWSPRRGYARTAEVSVYVDGAARRRGLGRALLLELEARARAAGLGVLLARIGGESVPSQRLHEEVGYRHVGTMRRVGEKLGRVLDVELYELAIS